MATLLRKMDAHLNQMFAAHQIHGIVIVKLPAKELLQIGVRAAAQAADIAQPQYVLLVQRIAHGIVMSKAAAQELAEIGVNQEVQVQDIANILHVQLAALQARGIAMMKLHAKEQQDIGARVRLLQEALLHHILDGALQAHAQPAPQLQNIIVIQKQTVKEQQEAGAVLNQVQEDIAVKRFAQLILVQRASHGTVKTKQLVLAQERAGAPAPEDMDIVQAHAQPATKLIRGIVIQKKRVLA